jgi:RNA polymerase sigma-70 factor (ECF subfamily)
LLTGLRYGFAPTASVEGQGSEIVVLTEIDRGLLERCLQGKPRAWEDFVDRFMGLVVHVVNHTAQIRGLRFSPEDRDDLVSEVFLGILKNDFAVLRHFRGHSSLATYLTVVARRIVVRTIVRQKSQSPHSGNGAHRRVEDVPDVRPGPGERIGDRDEVERLLEDLHETEAKIVRMYHLEGKSYREISSEAGVPENSIGPILSRARDRMRRAGVNPAAG